MGSFLAPPPLKPFGGTSFKTFSRQTQKTLKKTQNGILLFFFYSTVFQNYSITFYFIYFTDFETCRFAHVARISDFAHLHLRSCAFSTRKSASFPRFLPICPPVRKVIALSNITGHIKASHLQCSAADASFPETKKPKTGFPHKGCSGSFIKFNILVTVPALLQGMNVPVWPTRREILRIQHQVSWKNNPYNDLRSNVR